MLEGRCGIQIYYQMGEVAGKQRASACAGLCAHVAMVGCVHTGGEAAVQEENAYGLLKAYTSASSCCYETGMANEVAGHCQGMHSNSFTLPSTDEALAGEKYCPVLSNVVKERYRTIRDWLKESIRKDQGLEIMGMIWSLQLREDEVRCGNTLQIDEGQL